MTPDANPTVRGEGGVWGSYVQYVKDLEAENQLLRAKVDDLEDRLSIHEAREEPGRMRWQDVTAHLEDE